MASPNAIEISVAEGLPPTVTLHLKSSTGQSMTVDFSPIVAHEYGRTLQMIARQAVKQARG